MSYTPTEWESTDVVTATRLNALEQAVGDLNMSYTPNVWQNGDILTADKMNALEQAVASGGGGGSSDFSTAEVMLINNTENSIDIYGLCIIEDGDLVTGAGIASNTTKTIPVVLYEGNSSLGVLETTATVTTTGDIEYDADFGDLSVTGNGTITIS